MISNLDKELVKCRSRWVEAKRRGDIASMHLWEKVGNSVKARIAERIGLPLEEVTDTQIENIFGGKVEPLDKV